MSEAVRQQLESLKLKTDSDSLAEVIRRSLAIYNFLWHVKENGGVIQVKDNGEIRELVIL